MALHEAAMKDDYFIKRKLAPNVDFWYVHLWIWVVVFLFRIQEVMMFVIDDGGCSPKLCLQWLDLPCHGFVLLFRIWKLA